MESSFGTGLDPSPFVAGAYALGAVLILGYAFWVLLERRRLHLLLAAVRQSSKS